MDTATTILLACYILTIVLNFCLVFWLDKNITTIGDLIEGSWITFIPLFNILFTFMIIVYFLPKLTTPTFIKKATSYYTKFKSTKIRKYEP